MQRIFFVVAHCKRLRDDLAEEQYQNRQDTGSEADGQAAEQICSQYGCQRGSGDVDDVVSDQDRGQHLAVVFQDFQYHVGAFVAFLR